ncbi:hypothetical protein [Nostoc sp. NMS4]|uniref:hypothetical protein n=1 Tax=Nostoc sp. NMS4 TaxID=2815390 RepID=UPI0025DA7FA2|nr:hypothetical protein [Nostoc sp. NMS4]MBN3923252.1 hypothetical protein [Nostoc sp. NMS4]
MSDFLYHPTEFIFFTFPTLFGGGLYLGYVGAGDRLGAIASLINYLLDAKSWLVCHPRFMRINSVMSLVLVLKGFFLLVFTDF